MSNTFLEQYMKTEDKDQCIPGLVMNAPYIPSNGLGDVGLELEIEATGIPSAGMVASVKGEKTGSVWTTHDDGSLRGESKEFVLSTPCKIDELSGMLSGLYGKFSEVGMRWRLSNRCSTHVHVNVGGKKINELTSVIALWTMFEEPLIEWCGEERTTNHFCLSNKDSTALIDRWYDLLKQGYIELPDGFKYSALNVRPMQEIGSFEFRTMRASESYQPILDWSRFLHGMVEYASEKYSNPELLGHDLSERSAEHVFVDICVRSKVSPEFQDAVVGNGFNHICLEGFRRAQSIVYGVPWHRWMDKINEVYVPTPFGEKTKKKARRGEDEAVGVLRELAAGGRNAPAPQPRGWEILPLEINRLGEQVRGAAVGVNAMPAPPAPRVPPFNPGHPVDPNLPIEFGDGTPARLERVNHERSFQAVSHPAFRGTSFWNSEYTDTVRNYLLENGGYSGASLENPDYPWIRNVQEVEEDF